MNDETLYLAEIVWEYMLLKQPERSADCMLVLGSRDDRVAIHAANISKRHTYRNIVISGGISHTQDLLATGWGEQTEAEHFMNVYRETKGVGEILLESSARNTGDNALFSYKILINKGIQPESILIVTKPYMERRALATFNAQWPQRNIRISVTSFGGSLLNYCNHEQPIDLVINIMVGDMQRIIEYPKQGLQVKQAIPTSVSRAYKELIRRGYSQHLVK